MGTLAAVAIPAYNRYRSNAARGAFDATGTNIARAFQACVAVSPFTSCDSLSELQITPAYKTKDERQSPNFCAEMETKIGGNTFKGCVNVNAQTGNIVRTFNQQICWVDPVTTGTPPLSNDCDANSDGTLDTVKATGWQGGDCETPVSPLTLCNAIADCPDALNLCQSAQNGACAATGTCS